MRQGNPFTLNFGVEPANYISRKSQTDEVIQAFTSEPSPSHVFMITGVRGTGKTVFLSEIEDYFQERDWIVCDLSIESDLLLSLASKLYNVNRLYSIFTKAKLNLSFFGIGLDISGVPPVTDIETAVERMMDILRQHDQKLLIAIDEAVNSQSMRKFASEFQLLLRKRFPVYLLMTGLYENLYDLQNEKTLTFLFRAPKIFLPPLDSIAMMDSYQEIFHNSVHDARAMAQLTKGYSYAYQVLGYLCWESGSGSVTDDVLSRFDVFMDEYVYSKIWSEQSPVKQKILTALADSKSGNVTEIRQCIQMPPSEFSVYRQRLIRQGLVQSSGYGHIAFTLPRFEIFVRNQSHFVD